MTTRTPWFLFLAAVLFAAACDSGGDGSDGSTCGSICDAAAACEVGSAAAETRATCLEACNAVPASCRDRIADACLACFETCDSGCVETSCSCGQPGDPCEDNYDCEPGSICFNAAYCVGTGSLRITLSFEVDSDFDLHVLTPNGSEIYYASPYAEGGTLDVDQCVQSCGGGTHVENVVFPSENPAGTYQIWAVNYDGRGSGAFQLEVAQGDDVEHFSGTLPPEIGAQSAPVTFTAN